MYTKHESWHAITTKEPLFKKGISFLMTSVEYLFVAINEPKTIHSIVHFL